MFSNQREDSNNDQASEDPTSHGQYGKAFFSNHNGLPLQDGEGYEGDSLKAFIDEKALRMMTRMGYQSGSGLGRNTQGIKEPITISHHLGTRGLGLKTTNFEYTNETWDFDKDVVDIKEDIIWLHSEENGEFKYSSLKTWIKEGRRKSSVEDESNFCDKEILHNVLSAKDIFNELDLNELCRARARANPFEAIQSVFFMNRAALKMANIDAATDYMFTNINNNIHHQNGHGPYYFADVCAGPGGFTEYILWRTTESQLMFKGFGFTLKEENDFELNNSSNAPFAMFGAYYGECADGNVCNPKNITDFKNRVLHQTENLGVHFMMSDGGFSVEGNENMQEVLSKSLYACQCLVALEIVREHGHFVTKLFDTFTPFSVGLIYLMWNCFEKVMIMKPNTSRPANSERYLVCYDLKENNNKNDIRQYLQEVVQRLWELPEDSDIDILEIVPLNVLKSNGKFLTYITQINNSLGSRQINGLQKLGAFCRNPNLVEGRQSLLRKNCLEFWKIPDKHKQAPQKQLISDLITPIEEEILVNQPIPVNKLSDLKSTIVDINDWHFVGLQCAKAKNVTSFYAVPGLGNTKVHKYQNREWVKVKNLYLVPGTLLYGELVKERFYHKSSFIDEEKNTVDSDDEKWKFSLHVIDAIQLGNLDLREKNFHERAELINRYCKAINHENYIRRIRIRQKKIYPLKEVTNKIIKLDRNSQNYYCKLPLMGYQAVKERFVVNSILLLKTDKKQSFESTYLNKRQIFISPERDVTKSIFTLEDVQNFMQSEMDS